MHLKIFIALFLSTVILTLPAGCAKRPATAVLPAAVEVEPFEAASEPVAAQAEGAAVLVINLETIHFEYDSFLLAPPAREVLALNAGWLRANPAARVTIEGHCDERGSDEYNLALGERRAQAVRNFLATLGIEAERLAAVSYGEERPAVEGPGESAWAQNRRAAFVAM